MCNILCPGSTLSPRAQAGWPGRRRQLRCVCVVCVCGVGMEGWGGRGECTELKSISAAAAGGAAHCKGIRRRTKSGDAQIAWTLMINCWELQDRYRTPLLLWQKEKSWFLFIFYFLSWQNPADVPLNDKQNKTLHPNTEEVNILEEILTIKVDQKWVKLFFLVSNEFLNNFFFNLFKCNNTATFILCVCFSLCLLKIITDLKRSLYLHKFNYQLI